MNFYSRFYYVCLCVCFYDVIETIIISTNAATKMCSTEQLFFIFGKKFIKEGLLEGIPEKIRGRRLLQKEVFRDGMVGTSKGTMGNGFNHERIDILTMKRKNPDESH